MGNIAHRNQFSKGAEEILAVFGLHSANIATMRIMKLLGVFVQNEVLPRRENDVLGDSYLASMFIQIALSASTSISLLPW